jgi:predicted transporter
MWNLIRRNLSAVIFAKRPPSFEVSIFRYVLSGLLFFLAALLLWGSIQTQQNHYAWLLVPLIDGIIYLPPLRFSWLVQFFGGILFFVTFGVSG